MAYYFGNPIYVMYLNPGTPAEFLFSTFDTSRVLRHPETKFQRGAQQSRWEKYVKEGKGKSRGEKGRQGEEDWAWY